MDSHRLPQELQNPAVDDIYAKLEHYRSKLPSELQHTVTIVRPDKRKQPEADEQASVLVTASPSPSMGIRSLKDLSDESMRREAEV